jgi:hypothetical protein
MYRSTRDSRAGEERDGRSGASREMRRLGRKQKGGSAEEDRGDGAGNERAHLRQLETQVTIDVLSSMVVSGIMVGGSEDLIEPQVGFRSAQW